MIGYDLDRGGPKDSENAPNSFLTKINEKGFWWFATDIHLTNVKMVCKEKAKNIVLLEQGCAYDSL